MENENKMSVIKLSNANYSTTIQLAIEHGLPVLLENVLEEIDATLGMLFSHIFMNNLSNLYVTLQIHFLYFGICCRSSTDEKYLQTRWY